MRRHELDWASLIAGLLFVGVAVAYVLGAYVDLHVDARIAWAVGLIALGGLGVGAAVSASRRE